MSLLFDPSMNHTCAYSDIQRQVKETINAGRWLMNFRIFMVEFIQIKCYMYKIQVAGEEKTEVQRGEVTWLRSHRK